MKSKIYKILYFLFLAYFLFISNGFLAKMYFKSTFLPSFFLLYFFLLINLKIDFKYKRFIFVSSFLYFMYLLSASIGTVKLGKAIIFNEDFLRLTIKMFIVLIGFPIIIFKFNRVVNIQVLVKYLLVLGYIAVILQVFQWINIDFFSYLFYTNDKNFRATSFWGNANMAALYYLFLIMLHFIPFIHIKFKDISILLFSLGILLTVSRTSIFILLFLFLYRLFFLKKKFKYILAYVLLGFVLLPIIINYLQALPQFDRLFALTNNFEQVAEKSRGFLWQYTFGYIFSHSPFWGSGFFSMDRIVPVGNGLGPHNMFLWIWGSGGLMSVVVFIYWLFFLYKGAGVTKKNITKDFKFYKNSMMFIVLITVFTNHHLLKQFTFGIIISVYILVIGEWTNFIKNKNNYNGYITGY